MDSKEVSQIATVLRTFALVESDFVNVRICAFYLHYEQKQSSHLTYKKKHLITPIQHIMYRKSPEKYVLKQAQLAASSFF